MTGEGVTITLSFDEKMRAQNRIELLHQYAYVSENKTMQKIVEELMDNLHFGGWEAGMA